MTAGADPSTEPGTGIATGDRPAVERNRFDEGGPGFGMVGIERAVEVVVALMVVVAAASVVGLLVVDGPGVLAEPLLFLYICLVVAYGVFVAEIDHPRVQVAFGVGVALYGGFLYVDTGGSVIWLAIALLGLYLVVRNSAPFRE